MVSLGCLHHSKFQDAETESILLNAVLIDFINAAKYNKAKPFGDYSLLVFSLN